MKRNIYLSILIFLTLNFSLNSQQLAFPEAEGFGKYTLGARATSTVAIYHVTNLNDSGTGSLRDAISQPNRIVVFDVGGVINISSRLVFSSNSYIAGQTAPGDGVVVYGNGVSFSGAQNLIIRYMRFRMGINGDSEKDAAGIANGKNMIFDHVSVTWGKDETFSISWDNKGSEPADITIQNSIIGQGMMVHSAGGLIQTSGGITLYRNLYIDNKTRNPKVKGLNQFVNNVVYNWGSGGGYILGDSEGDSWGIIENNYFIKGPSTGGTEAFVRGNTYFQTYHAGNMLDYSTDGILNGNLAQNSDLEPVTFITDKNQFINSPKLHPEIEGIQTAENAYHWIKDNVGAVIPARDAVDKYMIDEMISLGTKGALINGEADLALPNAVGDVFGAPKQSDTDNDGIPDIWEETNGLNKTDKNDAVLVASNGYLNIENYINSINSGIPFLKYPTVLTVKSLDSNFATIKWKNNEPNATNIILEISTNNTTFTPIATLNPTITEYKAENLNPNTSYYFRLKSVSETLSSNYSEVLKTTTFGVAAPPVACTNPIPADKSTIAEYITKNLSWTNTTGIWGGDLYYSVYFGTDINNLQLIAADLLTSTYTVSLIPNTTYYWRVDTKNVMGDQTGTTWSFTSAKKTTKEKVAYFKFDETSGNSAFNNVQGNATALDFTPTWNAGISGNSIVLTGSPISQRLMQPHYSLLNIGNQSFSFDLWLKSAGGSAVDWYVFHKGTHVANTTTGATGKWYGLQYKNGILTFGIDDNVTKTTIDFSASQYFNNQWTYIACVRDMTADKLYLYINGVLKGQTTDNTGDINETGDLLIGNRNVNFDNPFNGNLDEFSIYKDALTAEEILENYNKVILSSTNDLQHIGKLKIYPSVFNDNFFIESSQLSADEKVSVMLFSTTGQLMMKKDINPQADKIKIDNLNHLAPGVYVCLMKTKKMNSSAIVIKK